MNYQRRRPVLSFLCAGLFALSLSMPGVRPNALADDLPQWGEPHTRNMVSDERGLPDDFEPGRRDPRTGRTDPATTRGVRWSQPIGKVGYGVPIIAEGRVLIGTNNDDPRDERMINDRGVLMCFDEQTGEYLWQLNVPKMLEFRNPDDPALMKEYRYADWVRVGICSPPTVENGLAYLVTNCCEVICLDLDGMSDGNDGPYQDEGQHMTGSFRESLEVGPHDADIVWIYDMMQELDVQPHNASNSSVLLDGNLLYLCTSNGVDSGHTFVPCPDAPTLIVLDKQSGQLVARDDFRIGSDIVHGQWSSPIMGEIDDQKVVFQGAGNGYIYACKALDPQLKSDGKVRLLENLWKFNGHPLAQTQDNVPLDHQHDTTSYLVTANPVFYDGKLYVVFTQELFHNIKDGWFCCLDPTLRGDTTRNGGLVWAHRDMGSSSSTPALADGLAYIADNDGNLYCLDAETGQQVWKQELGGGIWSSPLVADGKIYIGTDRRTFWIFKQGRQPELIREIRMPDRVRVPASAANGTLFIETMSQIFAIDQAVK